jgi:hypothetical protein
MPQDYSNRRSQLSQQRSRARHSLDLTRRQRRENNRQQREENAIAELLQRRVNLFPEPPDQPQIRLHRARTEENLDDTRHHDAADRHGQSLRGHANRIFFESRRLLGAPNLISIARLCVQRLTVDVSSSYSNIQDLSNIASGSTLSSLDPIPSLSDVVTEDIAAFWDGFDVTYSNRSELALARLWGTPP